MGDSIFISNNNDSNHLQYILKNFEEADEIWMATAFLKLSGLNLLLPAITKHVKLNNPIHIIAGQNFALTEPKALRKLFDLSVNYSKTRIYLDKAEGEQTIFHPKLFLFKKASEAIIISGSANITKGGLATNKEASLLIKTNPTTSSWKDTISYFEEMCSIQNAEPLNLMVINRYIDFFNEQKRIRVNQKASPTKKSSDYSFNYDKLKKRMNDDKVENLEEIFSERKKDYKNAQILLNEIVDSKGLTQYRFEEIIDLLVGKKGQSALWKSGSLFRHRKKVYNCKKEFIRLVKFTKDNQNSSSRLVFEGAKELVKDVNGARINYVTEIMMTYQPERFSNLNSNPITVLKEEAGVYFKSHSASYNGEDYHEYCLIIKEISSELGLNNMLEADSFFNEIYWKLKQESSL
nr:phospholipase D-like domain-containing protein [uncultured Flavobacterium sp.]